ncbi:hypothetical protein T484DRAFT_1937396 [Baffinella frigidus]|nr:hypothetical protein T484DRAFT_1937396 [Cryptophyta sp. CCMP2293]
MGTSPVRGRAPPPYISSLLSADPLPCALSPRLLQAGRQRATRLSPLLTRSPPILLPVPPPIPPSTRPPWPGSPPFTWLIPLTIPPGDLPRPRSSPPPCPPPATSGGGGRGRAAVRTLLPPTRPILLPRLRRWPGLLHPAGQPSRPPATCSLLPRLRRRPRLQLAAGLQPPPIHPVCANIVGAPTPPASTRTSSGTRGTWTWSPISCPPQSCSISSSTSNRTAAHLVPASSLITS